MAEDEGRLGSGSLLEGLAPAAPAPRVSLRDRLNGAWARRRAAWSAWVAADPARRPRLRRAGYGALVVVALGASVGSYLALRARSAPDAVKDPFEDVLDYTLLTDDFNKLPIDERLRMLKDIVQRFKAMDGSDSELVAAFAAGITGKARKQLEKNASRLVMDVMDREAVRYTKAPPQEKEKALDGAFVALFRTMDALDGKDTEKSDQEILEEGKGEARRGKEWIKKQDKQRLGRDTGRMMLTLKDTVAANSSAQERSRMTVMMRDMTRRLRGEPLE